MTQHSGRNQRESRDDPTPEELAQLGQDYLADQDRRRALRNTIKIGIIMSICSVGVNYAAGVLTWIANHLAWKP